MVVPQLLVVLGHRNLVSWQYLVFHPKSRGPKAQSGPHTEYRVQALSAHRTPRRRAADLRARAEERHGLLHHAGSCCGEGVDVGDGGGTTGGPTQCLKRGGGTSAFLSLLLQRHAAEVDGFLVNYTVLYITVYSCLNGSAQCYDMFCHVYFCLVGFSNPQDEGPCGPRPLCCKHRCRFTVERKPRSSFAIAALCSSTPSQCLGRTEELVRR